jgi:hypothetical protein
MGIVTTSDNLRELSTVITQVWVSLRLSSEVFEKFVNRNKVNDKGSEGVLRKIDSRGMVKLDRYRGDKKNYKWNWNNYQ